MIRRPTDPILPFRPTWRSMGHVGRERMHAGDARSAVLWWCRIGGTVTAERFPQAGVDGPGACMAGPARHGGG